jgi:predicted nucleic acid-binding protein
VKYLLPAQTLLDLCATKNNPARTWVDQIDTAELRVSVISIAEAHAAIDAVPSSQSRARLEANLASLLSQIESDSDEPLAFDEQHAAVWRALLNDDTLKGLGATDRQVYATAMDLGFTVVEEANPHTPALQGLGVTIQII